MKRPMLITGRLTVAVVAVILTGYVLGVRGNDDNRAQQRDAMVEEIENNVVATRAYLDKEALDPRVMAAMRQVERHQFVPERQRPYAYLNRPLPIGHGQTISQPYIVALMTDLLETQPGDRVFELGTGSGYQAAVLAEMAVDVYTVEIVEPLGEQARKRFESLGYDAVRTRIGDGYYGWPEHDPFDGIIVTAAASHVPPPLLGQLRPGGRMVIPVGSPFLTQQLVVVTKHEDGSVTTRQILPVRFVPLTGSHDNN